MEKLKVLFQNTLYIAYPLLTGVEGSERVLNKWQQFYQDVERDLQRIYNSTYSSQTFERLVKWVSKKEALGLSAIDILPKLDNYKGEIFECLKDDLYMEFGIKLPVVAKELPLDTEAKSDYIERSNAGFMYHLSDTIAKNKFTDDQDKNVRIAQLQDKQNSLVVVSSHDDGDMKLQREELKRWNTLIDSTFLTRVMDDLTADCLDIVTELWVKSAENDKTIVPVHYEQILDMCNMKQIKNGKAYYRKEDRLKIMERLAALASIFIYVNEDNEIVILNEEDPNETLAYKKQRIRRLFVMDEIIIAKDIDTDKTLGIESMNVTPGSFLSKYLYGSEKLTGLLSKKALEYNSKQQRYHKRLTRYLSWRWRIQQSYQHLTHSYSIGGPKGLLQVMEISMNRKPSLTRQVFEKTLDDLMRDQVIKEWKYSPEIDEEKCKGKNWFENYWLKLKVIISPTNELVKLQQELITKKSKQQSPLIIEMEEKPPVIEEKPISIPNQEISNSIEFYIEKMNTYKEKNDKSIRELAKEIDISYSTLSRMLSGKRKRLNDDTKNKLDKWIERQEVMNLL
ncbi:helix-turn-helix transcriptional regulator [Bacillus paranthracis]|uniref:helix-turn-helix domain-containing protein n=1 Tax=Bacillus cereus group TaxID=86661 RepID=UPI000936A25B|nr:MULTISPECIES: helix-turn-helix transcriptional regulator [Bacillus cereus group]MBL3848278.1 helix-turn-helix transcriptional regulator [Bacillus cereus]MDA1532085.1 helix-turn-helix transcriptional regulator [Bacillus cereus group sp. TH260-2LC]MDF9580378.1 helix-turn-helix transcriptional regulator [Bacillus paranthracis]MDG1617209.1 helix-turn-helix transcriptional regulator [Bacillus paranthracis]MDZ4486251.1 helix-turn-helix transcriptional regulator [Bacillus cereus]